MMGRRLATWLRRARIAIQQAVKEGKISPKWRNTAL
jgi:hypothetical protein